MQFGLPRRPVGTLGCVEAQKEQAQKPVERQSSKDSQKPVRMLFTKDADGQTQHLRDVHQQMVITWQKFHVEAHQLSTDLPRFLE